MPPFPGPALAARIVGLVTKEKLDIIRKATIIVEDMIPAMIPRFHSKNVFQYLAILHDDEFTGMVDNKRLLGNQIEIRCWDSIDAREAWPTKLPIKSLQKLAKEITDALPSVSSVTYNITTKPPSTIEAI